MMSLVLERLVRSAQLLDLPGLLADLGLELI